MRQQAEIASRVSATQLLPKPYLGKAKIKTRLLFWSAIIAVFVKLSTATANCDWLAKPRVCRVEKNEFAEPTVSIIEEVLDVELMLIRVPV